MADVDVDVVDVVVVVVAVVAEPLELCRDTMRSAGRQCRKYTVRHQNAPLPPRHSDIRLWRHVLFLHGQAGSDDVSGEMRRRCDGRSTAGVMHNGKQEQVQVQSRAFAAGKCGGVSGQAI